VAKIAVVLVCSVPLCHGEGGYYCLAEKYCYHF